MIEALGRLFEAPALTIGHSWATVERPPIRVTKGNEGRERIGSLLVLAQIHTCEWITLARALEYLHSRLEPVLSGGNRHAFDDCAEGKKRKDLPVASSRCERVVRGDDVDVLL